MKNLISVLEAQSMIISSIHRGPGEEIAIEESLHHVLAKDIISEMDIPAANLSSMDGYTVRSKDILTAESTRPVTLDVIAEIPAGKVPDFLLQPGQSARIMTGAALPEGADTVIPFEDIVSPALFNHPVNCEKITISSPLPLGSNVRPRGQDVLKGSLILPEYHRLEPQDIGMLAMTGFSRIEVMSKPRIGIFSTGDELITPGQPQSPGKIYESNSFMLATLVEKFGGRPVLAGRAVDNLDIIESSLNGLVERNVKIILTTGGVSVGTHDYVGEAITKTGTIAFWKVNIRPGKPLLFGEYHGVPYFGLPGNPVSSFVSFMVFVLPAIRKILGMPPLERNCVKAILEHPMQSDGRESYLRACLNQRNGIYYADPSNHQGSGDLFSLVKADALLIIPSGVKSLPAGAEVDAWLINSNNK